MKFGRPKSLRGMLVIGFALVTLPLLVAVVNAAVQMRQLAEQSAALVSQGVESTRHAQALGESLSAMERAARLWQLLGDPRLQESFAGHHARFEGHVLALLRLDPDPNARERLERLRTGAQGVASVVAAPADAPALTAALQRFEPLFADATGVSTAAATRTSADLAALQASTETAQRQLLWQSMALVPGTALLVLVFVMLLARPLRQIDRAIGELGRGAFSRPVTVSGPTDLQRLGQQLEWLRTRLLDLAQEKNRFLRHMSHELKTPLANIREGTELLMEGAVGPLDSAQREVTAILRENGIRLQRMIENLLSFSAWAAKGSALELGRFRLRPLVKNVLESQQLTVVAQRIRLDLKVPDLEITADRGKLRLILDNLLSNAVKYTPKHGEIHFLFALEGTFLVIDCADNGPGIAAEDRARIFEAFYTGATAPGGHVPGTGIGLSVVLEFVQAHGGTVELVDGQFTGAHFRLRLPMRAGAVAPVPASTPAAVAKTSTDEDSAHAA